MGFKFGVRRCQYSGNDPSVVPKPGLSVHGTRLFLACLSLDLDLMTVIVNGIRDIFKINIQLDAGFVGIAQRESLTTHLAIRLGSTGFVDTQSGH